MKKNGSTNNIMDEIMYAIFTNIAIKSLQFQLASQWDIVRNHKPTAYVLECQKAQTSQENSTFRISSLVNTSKLDYIEMKVVNDVLHERLQEDSFEMLRECLKKSCITSSSFVVKKTRQKP
ncbi:hypothetical protein GJ496_001309 [Pomphorhynchus laevis]|nr:hypothetical protein GJ496_001309 [Pomphorhynchus laevis]